MTETQFTSKLVKTLREYLGPAFIVWKHADGYTAGIPDISISQERDTMWIEVKLISNPHLFEPLQLALLKKLHGNYIIWDTANKKGARFLAIEPLDRMEVMSRCIYSFKELVENILNEV